MFLLYVGIYSESNVYNLELGKPNMVVHAFNYYIREANTGRCI